MIEDSDTKFETLAIYDKLFSFLKELYYLKKYDNQKKEQIKQKTALKDDPSENKKIREHHQLLLS